MTRNKAFRRHHFQRIYKKLRKRVDDWYKYSVMSGRVTEEEAICLRDFEATRQVTTRVICSNPRCCGNPRKMGEVTIQELRSDADMQEQLEQMFLERMDIEWWDLYDEERAEAEYQCVEDYEYEQYSMWRGTIDEAARLLELGIYNVDDFDWQWAWNKIEIRREDEEDI